MVLENLAVMSTFHKMSGGSDPKCARVSCPLATINLIGISSIAVILILVSKFKKEWVDEYLKKEPGS